MKNKFLVNLIMVVFLAVFLNAQAGLGRGRLSGSVLDETGKPVANAVVTVEFENSGKKIQTSSGQKGEWALLGLGTGRCKVMVMADGFLPATMQVTVSQLQRNAPVSFVLKIDHDEFVLNSDIEKKTILLRIFTVIAAKEGKTEPIENKDLENVLAEVSNLLSFKSYVLDGASMITVNEGAEFSRLALSSSLSENLRFDFKKISVLTGGNGKRSVKLEFWLNQSSNNQVLLSSETEIAENGYLVAGVSRIGNDGKSLVLVINAEIK
ncbi:MAG: carboxypeptidase-like regulatory domain-containing protein [Candidatus Aminicenantes bacterium]|nr:carboxypeptidase-like regulatory domain-containing protein [Candidatus Aminicenantes bacterium]